MVELKDFLIFSGRSLVIPSAISVSRAFNAAAVHGVAPTEVYVRIARSPDQRSGQVRGDCERPVQGGDAVDGGTRQAPTRTARSATKWGVALPQRAEIRGLQPLPIEDVIAMLNEHAIDPPCRVAGPPPPAPPLLFASLQQTVSSGATDGVSANPTTSPPYGLPCRRRVLVHLCVLGCLLCGTGRRPRGGRNGLGGGAWQQYSHWQWTNCRGRRPPPPTARRAVAAASATPFDARSCPPAACRSLWSLRLRPPPLRWRLEAPDDPSQPPAAASNRGRQPADHLQPAAGREVAAERAAGVHSGRRGKKRGHSPRNRHKPAAVGPRAVTRSLSAAADNEAAVAMARGRQRGKWRGGQ